MPTEQKLMDKVNESIHSEDPPLGKRAPGAPFAIVALTYIGVLLAGAVIMMLIMWLTS